MTTPGALLCKLARWVWDLIKFTAFGTASFLKNLTKQYRVFLKEFVPVCELLSLQTPHGAAILSQITSRIYSYF
jgi:hypothetical protein